MNKGTIAKHEIPIPQTNKKLSIEVTAHPVKERPDLEGKPNVAKIAIGGQEFFLEAGKTGIVA